MKANRSTSLVLLALTTATLAAGCGRTGPTSPVATTRVAPGGAIMAAGVERKLGYDWDRYQREDAPKARPVRLKQGLLAAAADLRAQCPPVYDQGKIGSCTAFAVAKGMRETLQRQKGEALTPLSGLFYYYETRASVPLLGWLLVKQDCGGTITGSVAVGTKKGAAPESTWAYDITKFAEKPPQAAYAAAPAHKFRSAKQLAGLSDVKASLAGGRTVAFGFKVYESFKKIGADGVMPEPAASEKMLGGHAVLAVGYDDAKNALIVRNSWSSKWGDKGYFYMPYAVAGDAGAATDFWTAE